MKCNFCGAELEEGTKVCTSCGAELKAEIPVQQTDEPAGQVLEAEIVSETAQCGENEVSVEEPVKKVKKKISWQVIVAAVVSVIALVCLGLALATAVFGVSLGSLFAVGDKKDKAEKTDKPDKTIEETVPAGTYVSDVDYTGTDKEAKKAAQKVVATMNGAQLTNGQLQIYYSMLVEEFLTNYYQYLGQLGLDLTLDLNTQACYFDDTISWETYFVTNAINNWKNYQAVCMMAEEEGFVLSDAMQEALQKLPDEMEKMAKESGYENADELISERMGGYCTLADYVEYSRIYYTGAEYSSILPSDDELSDYFDEYAEMFSEYGVTKKSGPIVDVRHILLQPDGGTVGEDGVTKTYSKEEWAACKEAAEAVYKEWKDGAATEESFAELANKHSVDPGSNTNGGLYTQITSETTFVEPFLNWCMDKKREVGDTGLVKTEHGYHIMYFSASEPVWLYHAKSQYISDRTAELMETAHEKWPTEINKENICIETAQIA